MNVRSWFRARWQRNKRSPDARLSALKQCIGCRFERRFAHAEVPKSMTGANRPKGTAGCRDCLSNEFVLPPCPLKKSHNPGASISVVTCMLTWISRRVTQKIFCWGKHCEGKVNPNLYFPDGTVLVSLSLWVTETVQIKTRFRVGGVEFRSQDFLSN